MAVAVNKEMVTGLRANTQKYEIELWLHNRKEREYDANSTFVKVNNIEVIGTEIEQYSQIHVDYYSQQTQDQMAAPTGMMQWKLITQ
jgi:hypothetical protein